MFNYNISIVNSGKNEEYFFYDFNSKINFHHIQTKHILKYNRELNNFIKKVNPDIIINCDNGFKGSLLPYLIKTNIPLIYERHCSKNISAATFTERIKLKSSIFFIEKSIYKYSNFIVLNAKEKKDWEGRNLKIIPNPLWFDKKDRSHPKNAQVAIAVGRHSFEKRYDKLIAIWSKVVEKHPDWILRIYGKENKRMAMCKLVNTLSVKNNIEFYSPINDANEIYSEASMLLTTSESEAFGLVLVEAMAFGLPVVAFNGTSGTETLVENGVNGFLIEKNDSINYIEKVNLLIENEYLRNDMGENTRKSVERFDLDSIMMEWHNLFQSFS